MTATQNPRARTSPRQRRPEPDRARPAGPRPAPRRRRNGGQAHSFRHLVEEASTPAADRVADGADDLRPAIERALPVTERRRLALDASMSAYGRGRATG